LRRRSRPAKPSVFETSSGRARCKRGDVAERVHPALIEAAAQRVSPQAVRHRWNGFRTLSRGGPALIARAQEVIVDLIRVLFAVLLPPLGVFMQERLGKRFWINVLLTMLGYIPGIIHAVYVIMRYEPERRLSHGS
jgi:uncharacterized membrane protein YqaE (UPF0057 family)